MVAVRPHKSRRHGKWVSIGGYNRDHKYNRGAIGSKIRRNKHKTGWLMRGNKFAGRIGNNGTTRARAYNLIGYDTTGIMQENNAQRIYGRGSGRTIKKVRV